MPDSNHILAEALARIENKLDYVLDKLGLRYLPPMDINTKTCPACMMPVRYEMDIQYQVVKRICGCKTGKQPFIIPELPAQQGVIPNARTESVHSPTAEAGPEPSPRSKIR